MPVQISKVHQSAFRYQPNIPTFFNNTECEYSHLSSCSRKSCVYSSDLLLTYDLKTSPRRYISSETLLDDWPSHPLSKREPKYPKEDYSLPLEEKVELSDPNIFDFLHLGQDPGIGEGTPAVHNGLDPVGTEECDLMSQNNHKMLKPETTNTDPLAPRTHPEILSPQKASQLVWDVGIPTGRTEQSGWGEGKLDLSA